MNKHLRPLTLLALALTLALSACAPRATPTMFIPPVGNRTPTPAPTLTQAAPPEALPTFTVAPPTITVTGTATQPAVTFTPTTCVNDLRFEQDLTIPDGTVVQPGASVEKQWLVTNSGTCDWTSSYR
ncbi:MAG: NBR1-Ig-like domain-containing protein, partial [Chloroflexota bacterium]